MQSKHSKIDRTLHSLQLQRGCNLYSILYWLKAAAGQLYGTPLLLWAPFDLTVGNLQPAAAVKCHVQKFTTLNSRVDARRPGLSSCTTKRRRTLRSHTLECRNECVLDCAIDSQADADADTDAESQAQPELPLSAVSQR